MNHVRVRFAPSPTGYMHIGGLRTALFNYLFARHHGGEFILRIEDTDRSRYVEGALENLIHVLEWAGLDYDEGPFIGTEGKIQEKGGCGPYIQSERVKAGIYNQYINQLLEEGKAYYCFCSKERLDQVRASQKEKGQTPRYDGHCRSISLEEARKRAEAGEEYVIRLKLPEHTDISFTDLVKGKITINTDEMDDQVLIKSDGFPTYHFAVVIDDYLMGISHVVRGEEWISSTPKHVYLYQAFGWAPPVFVHLPTVLGEDHKKLSKRNGDVSVESFLDKGYLPQALVNYISLLGWSPESNEEILSDQDLKKFFDFDRISTNGGIFDVKKLNWMNQEYIKKLPLEEAEVSFKKYLTQAGLIDDTYPEEKLRLVTETYQNRTEHFSQVPDYTRRLFLSSEDLSYDEDAREAIQGEEAQKILTIFEEKVKNAPSFDHDFCSGLVKEIQKETGIKGKNLWFPIRSAVVGQTSGPDFTNTLLVLGREEVISRLNRVKKEQKDKPSA